MSVSIYFRELCCDSTTEMGADEVYILVAAQKNDGVPITVRLPADAPREANGHWDMNSGDQPTDNPAGDSHCITSKTLLVTDLAEGQTLDAVVMIMEEDGGASKQFQEAGAQALMQSGNPYAMGAGVILALLTKAGFWVKDSDDYIGSFGVHVSVHNGQTSIEWRPMDRIKPGGFNPDPGDGGNPYKKEIRFYGDGSNYVGWFEVKHDVAAVVPPAPPPVPVAAPPESSAVLVQVDLKTALDEKAARSQERLDWRHSIVDLMKLLDLDSSLPARQRLAARLGYPDNTADTAPMNIWLHRQLLKDLRVTWQIEVPDSLRP